MTLQGARHAFLFLQKHQVNIEICVFYVDQMKRHTD